MIAGDPIHTCSVERCPTEQVTATDNDTYLYANTHQLPDLQRHAIQHLGVDTKLMLPHQGLARKLEQNAIVLRLVGAVLGGGIDLFGCGHGGSPGVKGMKQLYHS